MLHHFAEITYRPRQNDLNLIINDSLAFPIDGNDNAYFQSTNHTQKIIFVQVQAF